MKNSIGQLGGGELNIPKVEAGMSVLNDWATLGIQFVLNILFQVDQKTPCASSFQR